MLHALLRFTDLHGNGALPKQLVCNPVPQPALRSAASVSSLISETEVQQGINFHWLCSSFIQSFFNFKHTSKEDLDRLE